MGIKPFYKKLHLNLGLSKGSLFKRLIQKFHRSSIDTCVKIPVIDCKKSTYFSHMDTFLQCNSSVPPIKSEVYFSTPKSWFDPVTCFGPLNLGSGLRVLVLWECVLYCVLEPRDCFLKPRLI